MAIFQILVGFGLSMPILENDRFLICKSQIDGSDVEHDGSETLKARVLQPEQGQPSHTGGVAAGKRSSRTALLVGASDLEKGSTMCPKIYQGTVPVDLVEVGSNSGHR